MSIRNLLLLLFLLSLAFSLLCDSKTVHDGNVLICQATMQVKHSKLFNLMLNLASYFAESFYTFDLEKSGFFVWRKVIKNAASSNVTNFRQCGLYLGILE